MTALSFDGRVAVVTGAGGGLGSSHARELAARGASVVVNDLGGSVVGVGQSREPAEVVAGEINRLGGTAIADTNSVATEQGANALIERAVSAFGRVDVVINNAGILRDEAFHKITLEAWRSTLDVHLLGTMLVSRAAFRHMRKQGYGRIVNTTSAAGLFGTFGSGSYGAAKMGIVGLTRVLAIEGAGKGVRVNAIAPGAQTRLTEGLIPEGVDARPDLVTPAAVYLAHERCPLTGQILAAGFGRVGRVFVASTPGYFDRSLTAEAVEAHLEEIMEPSKLVIPETVSDDVALAMAHYELDPA